MLFIAVLPLALLDDLEVFAFGVVTFGVGTLATVTSLATVAGLATEIAYDVDIINTDTIKHKLIDIAITFLFFSYKPPIKHFL